RTPTSTLLPYTTLFRSHALVVEVHHQEHVVPGQQEVVECVERATVQREADLTVGRPGLEVGEQPAAVDPAVAGPREGGVADEVRSEEHTSELQSRENLV